MVGPGRRNTVRLLLGRVEKEAEAKLRQKRMNCVQLCVTSMFPRDSKPPVDLLDSRGGGGMGK